MLAVSMRVAWRQGKSGPDHQEPGKGDVSRRCTSKGRKPLKELLEDRLSLAHSASKDTHRKPGLPIACRSLECFDRPSTGIIGLLRGKYSTHGVATPYFIASYATYTRLTLSPVVTARN